MNIYQQLYDCLTSRVDATKSYRGVRVMAKIYCVELDTVYDSVVIAIQEVFGKSLQTAKNAVPSFKRELERRGFYGGINANNQRYSGLNLPEGFNKLTWRWL